MHIDAHRATLIAHHWAHPPTNHLTLQHFSCVWQSPSCVRHTTLIRPWFPFLYVNWTHLSIATYSSPIDIIILFFKHRNPLCTIYRTSDLHTAYNKTHGARTLNSSRHFYCVSIIQVCARATRAKQEQRAMSIDAEAAMSYASVMPGSGSFGRARIYSTTYFSAMCSSNLCDWVCLVCVV